MRLRKSVMLSDGKDNAKGISYTLGVHFNWHSFLGGKSGSTNKNVKCVCPAILLLKVS